MFLYNLTLGRPSGIQVRQWLAKMPETAAAAVPCLTPTNSCSLQSMEPSQSLTLSCTRLWFHVAKCWSCCAQMRAAECRQSTPLMSLVSSGKALVREGCAPMQVRPANLLQAHMRPPYGCLRQQGLLAVSAAAGAATYQALGPQQPPEQICRLRQQTAVQGADALQIAWRQAGPCHHRLRCGADCHP